MLVEIDPNFSGVSVRWTTSQEEIQVGETPWESDYPASLLPDEIININTASAADLERLPSIGGTRAESIVDYRTENGPFTEKIQLMEVSGIGLGTLEAIRDYITISS